MVQITLLLMSLLLIAPAQVPNAEGGSPQLAPRKVEVVYDEKKDRTTVRLAAVKISGARGKYHSLHMAPSYSYPGREPRQPEFIDFELRTVVKGKLKIDLYVLFIVDGEEVFLSSNRWAVRKGRLGRGWMGEHLVFRMPYETFLKTTRAKIFEIRLDCVGFPLGDKKRQALLQLTAQVRN